MTTQATEHPADRSTLPVESFSDQKGVGVGDTPQKPAKCHHKPELLAGAPIGQYHCPLCGETVIAGLPHDQPEQKRKKSFRCAHECETEEEWQELLAGSQGEFIGNFKDRLTFTGTITFYKKWEGEFGDQHLTIIADDKGNCIKYRNELHKSIILPDKRKVVQGLSKGDRVTFNATVVDHGVYEHPITHEKRKETVVQRAHVKDYELRQMR